MKKLLVLLVLVLGGCAMGNVLDEVQNVTVDNDTVLEPGSSDYDHPAMGGACSDIGTIQVVIDDVMYDTGVPDAFCDPHWVDRGDPDPTQLQLPDLGEQVEQEVIE